MTHASCAGCRLRFGGAVAAHLYECPTCAGPLELVPIEECLGLALFTPDGGQVQTLLDAMAARRGLPPLDGATP